MNIERRPLSAKIDGFLYSWFPVLPFLGYWVVAYGLFNFGSFVTPNIDIWTHIFIGAYMALFSIAYRVALRKSRKIINPSNGGDARVAIRLLRQASVLTFIGSLIFIYDRLASGAGSFAAVQTELYSVREELVEKVTILTTLAVIPQSFRIVAFAAYFYCLLKKLRIGVTTHILMSGVVALELLNMTLSANRGSLFWLMSYAVFYFIFVAKRSAMAMMLPGKKIGIKVLFIIAAAISYFYFSWVAENRVASSTAEYLGKQAFYMLKNPFEYNLNSYSKLGAEYQLFYYLTHGFAYIDAILQHAELLHFDFISPLGLRVEAQLSRFIPGYEHPAKALMLTWFDMEGLSRFGWPTVFGASVAYFGIIGALFFSIFAGYFSGYSVRRWERTNNLGWLIIVFLIFSSLNMSFDWIIRNFDQYVAFLVGIYLIRRGQFMRTTKVGVSY